MLLFLVLSTYITERNILSERVMIMAKSIQSPTTVTEENKPEKFMLYPTILFNETDEDEFKRGSSAIASHTYMRGLVMGICDKFGHPVVILQRNNDPEKCKKCETCGKDENTAFCGNGEFLRLESTLFYDHWAKVCKKIREKDGKIRCCQRDDIIADYLLKNLNNPKKTDEIYSDDKEIKLHISKEPEDGRHICVRYECPDSHYDEIAVNINVKGIQGVMIIGQLLFSNTPKKQTAAFEETAKALGYDEKEIDRLIDSAKVKRKNFASAADTFSEVEKNALEEPMSVDAIISEIFKCVEKLEKSLEKEYDFKTDINVKDIQEEMVNTFNDCYQKNAEIEKENIDKTKKCEKKYELLKTAFYDSLKVFCKATDFITELYASAPKGLYLNSENGTEKIKTDTTQNYQHFFNISTVIKTDEFAEIGNGYYEFCKKLDVAEEKYVRIIIKTDRKDEVINKIFSGFLQFVCLYITELFAQYNGAQISAYTTMMRHELGQLNEAILIRINTFQEAVGKQEEDYYTYSFLNECNHVIEDFKSHAHSTMLRCNSSRYFTRLPAIHKELFYPYESFLYKWKYIYERAAKNKHVNFLMEPVMLSDLTRPRMYADEAMVEQVAYNLTNNAIKYSIPGTTISIDCKLNDRKDAYQLIVTNYGRALREDEIDRIFDYGFRGSNHNEANGSGLGLYLSQEIAKEHGGELTLEVEKVSDYDVSCLYLYSEMPERFQYSEIRENIKKELLRLKETKYFAEIEKPQLNNQSFTPYLIRRYLNTGTIKYKFVLTIPYDKNSR